MLPIVMAGISAATSIAGGIMNSRTAKAAAEKQQAMLDKQKAENAAWYNRRYFEDGTQRADVQRVLTRAQDTLRRNNQAAAGTNAVMGGTNATAAAAKEANNMAYADMVSDAAARAEERKDNVENTYMQTKQSLDNKQIEVDNARAEAKQKAVSDAVQSVGNVAAAAASSPNYGAPAQTTRAVTPGTIRDVGNNSAGVVAGKNAIDNFTNNRVKYKPITNDKFTEWVNKWGGNVTNLE